MPPEIPPAKAALELRAVSKFFGNHVALNKVGLRIEPGDCLLLYGPNGAGKTTLLRILATLARPSEGEVLFDGEDVYREPARARARLGFVSHATFLYGELTARENLKFAGTLFRLDNLEKRVEASLEIFGLRGRAGVPVRELSRGLQQRASLARAFLHEPEVLLLDEPFTGLDAQATKDLEGHLRHWAGEGKTLVFSTHDFRQGAAIARRLVALEGGAVQYDGDPGSAPPEAVPADKVTRR